MHTMRGFVPPDAQTEVSTEHYAVIYMPKRSRKRFPAGCVEIVASKEEALALRDEDNKRFAARVLGPSKSSEGQLIYYLVAWLTP
jgi:hypothetical protein